METISGIFVSMISKTFYYQFARKLGNFILGKSEGMTQNYNFNIISYRYFHSVKKTKLQKLLKYKELQMNHVI